MLEALVLDSARFEYAFAHHRRGLAGLRITQLVVRHSFYLALDINSVKQRPAYLRQVAVHLRGCAGTRMSRVVLSVMSAGTRVHRCHEHERRRIFDGIFGTRDGDLSVFKRLPHHFERRAFVFGQFIEEEHAVVGKGYLSRMRIGTSADKGDIGDGMMRRTKRPLHDK